MDPFLYLPSLLAHILHRSFMRMMFTVLTFHDIFLPPPLVHKDCSEATIAGSFSAATPISLSYDVPVFIQVYSQSKGIQLIFSSSTTALNSNNADYYEVTIDACVAF